MQSMVEELAREGFHISDGIGVSSIYFPFIFFLSLDLFVQPDPVSPETDWIETSSIKFDDQVRKNQDFETNILFYCHDLDQLCHLSI